MGELQSVWVCGGFGEDASNSGWLKPVRRVAASRFCWKELGGVWGAFVP